MLSTYTHQPNNGKLLSVTYGNGFSESYTYDALGRVVGIQHGEDDAVLYEYAYNSEGHLVSYRDYESGRLCEYAYDAITGALIHQVLKNTEDGATAEVISVVSYLYDDYGRQVGRTVDSYGFLNEDVAYAAVYEAGTGNLIAYQIGANKAFLYTYDGFYRLTEKVLQAEAFSYEQLYTYQSFTDSTGQRTNYRVSRFSHSIFDKPTPDEAPSNPTEDTRPLDPNGDIVVTPDVPPTAEDGYVPPQKGVDKKKVKDGKEKGWVDSKGNRWVPAPTGSGKDHGGGHWDVNRPDGKGYINVYPGGHTREGAGKAPVFKRPK